MAKYKRLGYALSATAMLVGSGVFTSVAWADGDCAPSEGLAADGYVASAAELEYVIQNGISEVKIANDFVINCYPSIMSNNLKIDLNSNTVEANVPWALDIETADKTLVIEDSGEGGTIRFNDAGIWVEGGANLTINSGTISVPEGRGRGIVFRDGVLTLAGGIISANNGTYESNGTTFYYPTVIALRDSGDTTVNISGGEIDATNGVALSASGATVSMSGNTIHGGDTGIEISDGAVFTMNSGDVDASTWVVSAFGESEFIMNGGSLTTTGPDSIGVSGNGTNTGTKLTLNAGTITSNDLGVYAPQIDGITTLGEGLSIDAAKCGVEVRAGTLSVEGATINVDADAEYRFDPNGNGSTASGVGIAVAQHTTQRAITATVSDGVFTAPVAFAEGNPQQNDDEAIAQVTLSVTGGEFNATNGDPVVASEDVERFVSGGKYNKEPDAKYIVDGYEAYSASGGAFYNVLPISHTAGSDTTDDEGSSDAIAEELNNVANDVLGVLHDNFNNLEGSDPVEFTSGAGAKFWVFPDDAKWTLEQGNTLIASLGSDEYDLAERSEEELVEIQAWIGEDRTPFGLMEYWIDLNENAGNAGGWIGEVTEIPYPITLTYDVSGAPAVPAGMNRDWKVTRLHWTDSEEPEITHLPAAYDDETGLISYENDKFSVFIVSYEDSVQDSEDSAQDSKEDDEAATPETGTVTAAGASAINASLMAAVVVGMLVSIMSFAYLVRKQ